MNVTVHPTNYNQGTILNASPDDLELQGLLLDLENTGVCTPSLMCNGTDVERGEALPLTFKHE